MKSLDMDTVGTNLSDYGSRRVAIEFTGGYQKQSIQLGATCKVIVPYGSFAQKLQSIHRLGGKVINVSIVHSQLDIAKFEFEQVDFAQIIAISTEEVIVIEPQALIPEEIPVVESQVVIPEEVVAIEPQAVIFEEIPEIEPQALIPEEIPVVEAQALIPEEFVAIEPQALIPEETPFVESQVVIPEEVVAILPEEITFVETPQTIPEEVPDTSIEQTIEKSVVETLEINVELFSPEIIDKVAEEVPVIASKKEKAASESTTKPKKSKASTKVSHGLSKQKDLSEAIQSNAIAETNPISEPITIEPILEPAVEVDRQPAPEPEQAITFAEIISEPVADIVLEEIVAPIIEIIPAQEPEPIVETLPEIIVEKSIETVSEPITDEIIEPINEPVSENIAEITIEANTSTLPTIELIESAPSLSKSQKTKTSSKSGHGFNKPKNDAKKTRKPKS